MPRIVIRSRGGSRSTLELEGRPYVLGRRTDSDIPFPADPNLSRRHMEFVPDAYGWCVRDLGSKNGTFVNGEPVQRPRRLAPGDRVQAGGVTIVFDPPENWTDSEVEFVPAGMDNRDSTGMFLTSLEQVLTPARPRAGARSGAQIFMDPRVQALLRAGRELATHRPVDELFPLILDMAREAVGAERGVLFTREEGELRVRAARGDAIRVSTSVRDQVLQERRSVLVRDVALDDALQQRRSIISEEIQTMLAVPLQTEDRVIGMLYVDSRQPDRQFGEEDLELLTVLANHAAVGIEQARMRELKELEERQRRDLQQAAEIQRHFLPPMTPRVPGLELAAHNAACRTVGGDYYDFFTRADGTVAVVLGDVAGKGLSAALLMCDLRARLQVLVDESRDLAELMTRLNRMMASQCPDNRFVSLFFAWINPRAGTCVYCNAGHNPPLVRKASGEVLRLGGGGPALGLFEDSAYELRQCGLEGGDLCIVFSDGLVEASDPAGEEFGEERVRELLERSGSRSAETVLAELLDALGRFTLNRPQEDDITIAVLRYTG